jgi:saccharopine dehydrogenase (NAD+, L-lysine-forming)
MTGPVMVYGATGYSGRALARRLCEAGRDVVVAGRDGAGVEALARSLNAPFRVFSLRDAGAVDLALTGVAVVLHAAGPFTDTAAPMIDACIRTGTHYLDLSGEWPVFARAQALDAQARAAGVMLMPGVGWVVVLSDCLAAQAVRACPDTTLLRIASEHRTPPSRGTLRSALATFGSTVVVRRAGVLRSVPVGPAVRSFDFGSGERLSVAVSWPDVVTAFATTGVAHIEGYMSASLHLRVAHRAGVTAAEVLGDEALRRGLMALAGGWPARSTPEAPGGPCDAVVVEAEDPWRRATRFGLKTPDGYLATGITASAIVARVLAGEHPPGFRTPAGAYGPDLIGGLGCAEPYDPGRFGAARDSNASTAPHAGIA